MGWGKTGSDAFAVGQARRKSGEDGANAVRGQQRGEDANVFDRWAVQKANENGQIVERGWTGDHEVT